MPDPIPLNVPVVDIVPTAGLLLLHVPPGVLQDSTVVWPVHRLVVPVMGPGSGFMVMV